MIEFVPLPYYSTFFFNFILVLVLFTWIQSFNSKLTDRKNLKRKQLIGLFVLLLLILYIGLRPISGYYFGDMGTYVSFFEHYKNGGIMLFQQDIGFDFFMSICAKIMEVQFFFLVSAFLYVFPIYLASKRLFKEYWFYSFLFLIGSFSFWSFGTNGIRNGIATSLALLALSYLDKKIVLFTILLVAVSFHKSMLLIVGAYLFTLFYNDSKKIFYFWLLCIPVSLVAGGFFESLFGSLGFDERISYLTSGNINNDDFSSTGFRWDFLVYSGSAVYTGWYFIFKNKFNDLRYQQLYNIFLIANGFWILVIRANFSNRFAYLSWFMMGIVIVYPFLTKIQVKKQHQVLGLTLFAYYSFTYLMNVIL